MQAMSRMINQDLLFMYVYVFLLMNFEGILNRIQCRHSWISLYCWFQPRPTELTLQDVLVALEKSNYIPTPYTTGCRIGQPINLSFTWHFRRLMTSKRLRGKGLLSEYRLRETRGIVKSWGTHPRWRKEVPCGWRFSSGQFEEQTKWYKMYKPIQ